MRVAYPIQIKPQDGAFVATFPGLPGLVVSGPNVRLVRQLARERLLEALRVRVAAREDLPAPTSRAKRQELVAPPVLLAAKLALYQTMRDQSVSNMELARRIGTVEGTVRRLVDPRHRSRIDSVEDALGVLNKRLVIDLQPRAQRR